MQIFINGEEKQVPDDINMTSLVALLELGDQRFAVEINQDLIPRSTFDNHQLGAGDKVEIVHAIGGG